MESHDSTISRIILACAIIALMQAGIAAFAHTDSGGSAFGMVVRIGVMPVVLLALWGSLRRTAFCPAVRLPRGAGVSPAAVAPPLAGLCLGGLLAVGNVLASRAGISFPPPRYPFGPEPVVGMAALLIVGVIAPLAEEFFFRGILLRYMWARRGPTVAIIVSAAAFALAHGEVRLMAQAALGGLIFGASYVRFRSIAVPILAHIGTNLSYVLIAGGGAQWLAGLSPIMTWGAGVVCAAGLAWIASGKQHGGTVCGIERS